MPSTTIMSASLSEPMMSEGYALRSERSSRMQYSSIPLRICALMLFMPVSFMFFQFCDMPSAYKYMVPYILSCQLHYAAF